MGGSTRNAPSVSAAALGSLKSSAAAQLLPAICASVEISSARSPRKLSASAPRNATHASSNVIVLVNIMISVCFRRRERFRNFNIKGSLGFHEVGHVEEFGTDFEVRFVGRDQIYFQRDFSIAPRQVDHSAAFQKIIALAHGQHTGVLEFVENLR